MNYPKVAIIDYGVGNLRSVEKAFHVAGCCEAVISSDKNLLNTAARLVLPGVGAFAACMKALKNNNLDLLVRDRANSGVPLLGVCVGMQMLFDHSEEFGSTAGLGLIPGCVRRFDSTSIVVPHVGWNQVSQAPKALAIKHKLFSQIPDDSFFYFVHSYYCSTEENVIGTTEYGLRYASAVARQNIAGVQFHPEKSQTAGLQLLRNFAQM